MNGSFFCLLIVGLVNRLTFYNVCYGGSTSLVVYHQGKGRYKGYNPISDMYLVVLLF